MARTKKILKAKKKNVIAIIEMNCKLVFSMQHELNDSHTSIDGPVFKVHTVTSEVTPLIRRGLMLNLLENTRRPNGSPEMGHPKQKDQELRSVLSVTKM